MLDLDVSEVFEILNREVQYMDKCNVVGFENVEYWAKHIFYLNDDEDMEGCIEMAEELAEYVK